MKRNLRSACLLFLVFIFFISGLVGLASAREDTNNDTFNYSNVSNLSILGYNTLPTTEYPIWGYTNKNYTFFIYNTFLLNHPSLSKTNMVFYWDCLNNQSDYQNFLLSDSIHIDNNSQRWKCTHAWNNIGNYSVAVGLFNLNSKGKWVGENVSYWIPVEIRNNTTIIVQSFSMLDEKEGFDGNYMAHLYNIPGWANSSEKNSYCGYSDNDYSFCVNLNATSLSNADNRTITETTTVIDWDDNTSDDSLLRTINNKTTTVVKWDDNNCNDSILRTTDNNVSVNNISDNESTKYTIKWNENFTHEWDKTGPKNINASFFHWDPLDGNEMHSNNTTASILIIRDPKNFFSISSNSIYGDETVLQFFSKIVGEIFSNLQNWGIFLSILGLIIFYFTYTRNNVPIEISIFEWKPFCLRSVNSFTGTLIFVAGMYLYFIFGRCPWDIPIISNLPQLPDMYFNMLYYEYTSPLLGNTSLIGIPYLSILLGLIDMVTLSLVIHLIAIPFYRGELKIGKYSRRKSSSTSAQPELISSPVETIINQKN